MKEYYDTRAPTYDDWYLGRGKYADRDAAGWERDLAGLTAAIHAMPPARTLDVACGTGFLTRHLPGEIVGFDQSPNMLAIAREQAPNAEYVQGDAFELPFADGSFERIFTGHFWGHLDPGGRDRFLAEARRVAREIVVADAAVRADHELEEIQPREVDGRVFPVLKRFFTPESLAAELGGGTTLYSGPWFVLVTAR